LLPWGPRRRRDSESCLLQKRRKEDEFKTKEEKISAPKTGKTNKSILLRGGRVLAEMIAGGKRRCLSYEEKKENREGSRQLRNRRGRLEGGGGSRTGS